MGALEKHNVRIDKIRDRPYIAKDVLKEYPNLKAVILDDVYLYINH